MAKKNRLEQLGYVRFDELEPEYQDVALNWPGSSISGDVKRWARAQWWHVSKVAEGRGLPPHRCLSLHAGFI